MLNKIQLIGRLGADPEVKTTESGLTICRLRMATSEKYKDKNGETKDATEWHTINAFDKQAEVLGQYCKKGMLLYVEGKIGTRSWQAENGETKYITEVRLQSFQFLESKSAEQAEQKPTTQSPSLGEVIVSDDLPF